MGTKFCICRLNHKLVKPVKGKMLIRKMLNTSTELEQVCWHGFDPCPLVINASVRGVANVFSHSKAPTCTPSALSVTSPVKIS